MSTDQSTAGRSDILVCLPTYNEADNIRGIVARIHTARPDVHVLVADDDSPDGTGAIADSLAAADARVHVLHRPAKSGLGAAYLEAFSWGLERGYEVIVEMDADGSHRPEDLGALLDGLSPGTDIALGSRWVPGGSISNWSKRRVAISRIGNAYARLLLGLTPHDVTGGFRAYRSDSLATLDLDRVASQGYCFQIDLLRRAAQQQLRVREVPITFVEREHGTSKMSMAIVIEALIRVTVWAVIDDRPGPFATKARRLPDHGMR